MCVDQLAEPLVAQQGELLGVGFMLGKKFCAATAVLVSALVLGACVPATPTGSGSNPTAVIVASAVAGVAPLEISFDGRGSVDKDGSVVSWVWDFGDGGSASGSTARHVYLSAGTYTATLTVTDNTGRTGSSVKQIVVDQPNAAPVADFTASPLTGKAPLTVDFDAASSSDTDGTVTTWAWDFGDGATATDVSPTHTFEAEGSYTVTLSVTDDAGATASSTLVIGVGPANAGPAATFTTSVGSGKAPLGVAFDASASADSDGTIATYEWDFGDGATATGATPLHTFSKPGSYSVNLQVTDDDGAVGLTSRPVVVAPANVRPVAAASLSASSGKAPLAVTFDGAGSTDADGSVVSYAWDFGDGGTASGATASHTFTDQSTRTVTLTVTDDDGATDQISRTVEVAPTNVAPVAVVSPTSLAGQAPFAADFDGTDSTDVDGSVVSYAWDFGDGGTASGASPAHTFAEQGTFTVTLTVTDDDGAVGTTTAEVQVAAPNVPPVAVAGASAVAGQAPLAVVFSSDGTNDPDGSIATYSWDFGDGSSAGGASPTHTFTQGGSYTVTLMVTDNQGAASSVTTTVVVAPPNGAPTAAISVDPTTGTAPEQFTFDGSGSSDGDGTVVAYEWDFGDGASSSSPTPTHAYTAGGSYSVELTVTDNQGATGTSSLLVAVADNQLPAPQVIADPTSGQAPLDVSFDGTGSLDPDGTLVSYAWSFGDGSTATGRTASHTYTAGGTFTVTLTVTDNKGGSASATSSVQVAAPNLAPVAAFSPSPSSGQAPVTVTYDAEASTDADGSVASYAWDFGDGTTGTGATVFHDYASGGSYVVRLTVTDNQGATGSTEQTLVVAPPNVAPTASIVASPPSGQAPVAVTFDGSDSADADGPLASYAWDFGDGATGTGETTSHTYSGQGIYTVTLTVTDDQGVTGSTTTTVAVSPPNLAPTAGIVVRPSTTATSTVPSNVAVHFDGLGSADPDGTVAAYDWDFGDGTTGSGPSPTHTFGVVGTFVVTLTVSDNQGAAASTTTTVYVGAANQAPTASFCSTTPSTFGCLDGAFFPGTGALAWTGNVPYSKTAITSTAKDADGTIVDRSWDFGDGSAGSGLVVAHTWTSVGTYTITQTVTDNWGFSTSLSKTVIVKPPLPVVTISGTSTSNSSSTRATVNFSVDWKGEPAGTCTATAGSLAAVSGPCSSITMTGLTAGTTYNVVVRATNSTAGTGSKSTSVTTPGRRVITSYDRMAPGAPYNGYFLQAWQGFVAQSNTITYLGVTVGSGSHVQGQTIRIRICSGVDATNGCSGTTFADVNATINNYGNSDIDIGDLAVNPGQLYYIVYTQPAGKNYYTYWWAGGAGIANSDQNQAIVLGYNR